MRRPRLRRLRVMDPVPMRDFLVFERVEPRGGSFTDDSDTEPRAYACITAVRAKDEAAAAQAVVGVIRRLPRLAIVPAVFIDFASSFDEPTGQRAELNP